MRHGHNRFFPAREIERVTWRDYAVAFAWAIIFALLLAYSI